MKRKRSQHELDHVANQVAHFTCGLCPFAFTGRLDEWLKLRANHRALAHPDHQPRKISRGNIAGAKGRTHMREVAA